MDLNQYGKFVKKVTSEESNDCEAFFKRVDKLETNLDLNVPLILTSCLGLSSEAGEFTEIIKKMVFQGKEFTPDIRFHLKRELGDVLWYWVNACRALKLDPNDVLQENVRKLSSRYPEGHFNSFFSENRQEGDL